MLVGVLSSHHVKHEEKTVGAHAWLKEKPCKGWTNLRTKGTMALGPCGNEETQQALEGDGPVLGEGPCSMWRRAMRLCREEKNTVVGHADLGAREKGRPVGLVSLEWPALS